MKYKKIIDLKKHSGFRIVEKKDLCILYLFDYVSVANIEATKKICKDQDILNQYIFKFKNGDPDIVIAFAELIQASLKLKYPNGFKNKNYCLAVIPASKKVAHIKRFELFCEKLSELLGVDNFFDEINRLVDQEDSRKSKHSNRVLANLETSERFNNKNVILIDDVTTTGRSFEGLNEYLNIKGVKNIVNISLANTLQLESLSKYKKEVQFNENNEEMFLDFLANRIFGSL